MVVFDVSTDACSSGRVEEDASHLAMNLPNWEAEPRPSSWY